MRKSVYLLLLIGIALGPLSCATVQTSQAPLWTADAEAVFPNRDFIAQKGYGIDRKNAENDALSAISRYFSMTINTSAREAIRVTDEGSTSVIDSETFVNSQANLFAVNYTEPWYNQTANQWETVAYINRAEAWDIFEPRLRQKADAFRVLVEEADRQREPFTKILLYSNALSLVAAEELMEQFFFADALNPLGASFFSDTRSLISELPATIERNVANAGIYVECENDYNGSIYTAVAAVFSNAKFPVAKEKSSALYVCMVVVGENAQQLNAGTFYYPTVSITLNGRNGVVASYNNTLERIGAADANVAKRRAYDAIANEIQKSLFESLR